MKRILVLFCSLLLLAACHNESRDPVIKDYRLNQVGGMSLGQGGLTAELVLEIDVDNPSSARYTLESLLATLYRGYETTPYAEATMQGTAAVEPRSEQTVAIPLSVRLARPLALLTEGFSLELSDYVADVDLTIRKGSLKKRIKKERVPLEELGALLGSTSKKQETDEKE